MTASLARHLAAWAIVAALLGAMLLVPQRGDGVATMAIANGAASIAQPLLSGVTLAD